MDLMTRVIRRLIPLRIGVKFTAVIDAIAASVETLYQTIRAIVTESNPSTAESTLEQWYEMLGMKYDPEVGAEQLRVEAAQQYSSIGSQTASEIERVIQIAFPGLILTAHDSELSDLEYRISGTIAEERDEDKLRGLIQRIGPAEMDFLFDPVEVIKSLEDTEGRLILDTDDVQILGVTQITEA